MKIDRLVPVPAQSEPFRRDRARYIPGFSGCYALATFEADILYVGLASNLRRRMVQHLDNGRVTKLSPAGRAVLFHWIESRAIEKVERTWLNIHIQHEGKLPVLNRVYSPTPIEVGKQIAGLAAGRRTTPFRLGRSLSRE